MDALPGNAVTVCSRQSILGAPVDALCSVCLYTGQSLSGASFTAVSQLQEHIDAFISAWNEKAEPFFWTKKKVRQRRFKGRRITQL